MNGQHPEIGDIRTARERISPYLRKTPLIDFDAPPSWRLGPGTKVHLKLELFQLTGTFKARAALLGVSALDEAARDRGVVAVSAGNHAVAVSFAASIDGVSARVVMPRSADPLRVSLCRTFGADVVLTADVHEAFETVHSIARDEGRTLIHPFEGPLVALGTGTLGLDVIEACPDADVVLVPVGGGGLAAGVAAAVKQVRPEAVVIGIEPAGADSMFQSFRSGKPECLSEVRTIADSLGAPCALPYSFSLCKAFLDRIVLVDDDDLCRAMFLLFRDAKLAVEPAGAAATAGLLGPLCEELAGRRVVSLVSGSNISPARFSLHLERGRALVDGTSA